MLVGGGLGVHFYSEGDTPFTFVENKGKDFVGCKIFDQNIHGYVG